MGMHGLSLNTHQAVDQVLIVYLCMYVKPLCTCIYQKVRTYVHICVQISTMCMCAVLFQQVHAHVHICLLTTTCIASLLGKPCCSLRASQSHVRAVGVLVFMYVCLFIYIYIIYIYII
jgi:hypothetical protein